MSPSVRHIARLCSNTPPGWLLLVLALGLALSPIRAEAGEPETVATTSLPNNRGTGFFVSGEGHFITANHVIGGCSTNAVLTPGGAMPTDLVARSKEMDLALIKTRSKPVSHGRFSVDPAQALRRTLSVTGYLTKGGLGSGSTTTGRFLGRTSARGGRFAIKAKDAIAGGNSGSPVVDYRGGIVGMLVARGQKDRRIGIAVDVFAITEFLSQSAVKIKTVPGGEHNPLAGGATSARAYTFPVLCLTPKKKNASDPN